MPSFLYIIVYVRMIFNDSNLFICIVTYTTPSDTDTEQSYVLISCVSVRLCLLEFMAIVLQLVSELDVPVYNVLFNLIWFRI